MSIERRNIEVCFSPALFTHFKNKEAIVVIVDILRATSAIVTAFMNGVDKIIPVGTLEEAENMKNKGYMVAAERDGIVRDFADFGNSPFNFTAERIKGKKIVYSTTNGTQAIHEASECYCVAIGAYLNFTALCDWLINENRDVVVLCAAWKNKFNLEDSLFAGAVSAYLLKSGCYKSICDSVYASVDLYNLASDNLLQYIEKAAQRHRLKKNKLDDVIGYCHTYDLTKLIPVLEENYLTAIHHKQ